MRSPARLLGAVTTRLEAAGIDSAGTEAGLLLEAVSGTPRLQLPLDGEPLSDSQLERLEGWVRRREQREPLQLILGSTQFRGLELRTAPGVLIPRPETELLVEKALARLAGTAAPRIVDVGCGSGAISLALAHERPDAVVTGTDISPAALALAARNAQRLGLHLELLESDLLTAPAVRKAARVAHLIVSNPPYLPAADMHTAFPEVLAEPAEALYSGPDGLETFRRLLEQAGELLQPGAALLVELDPRNVRLAAAAASPRLWFPGSVTADLAGRDRFLLFERK